MVFVERFNHRLGQLVWLIDKVEEFVTSGLLVYIVVINGMEIVTRLFFNSSLFFVYENNLLLANWVYFIGICLVYNRRRDIVIEFFYDFLSRRNQRILMIVIQIVIVVVLSVIAYYGYQLILVQSRFRTQGLGIPNHYFTLPVIIGAVSMILIVVNQCLDTWLGRDERFPGRP